MERFNLQKEEFIQEDEIDLRELILTIWSKKVFIISVTLIVTIIAIIYAYMKTPVYEANALIEIGSYKLKNTSVVKLDDANSLAKKLNVIYIEQLENIKDRESKIVSITVPKRQKDFLEIKAEAINNELAKQEIKKVVSFIKKEHQNKLDDEKQKNTLEIKNIENQIERVKNKDIKNLEKRILLSKESLKTFNNQLKDLDENVKRIQNKNPSLAALKLMEKRDLSNYILDYNMQLIDLENRKDKLETKTLSDLEEKKKSLESIIAPYNYKNTEIVGDIITNDYPAKPKKKLIVVVAFVTGFILSIFLVFFMQFVRSLNIKEETK